MREWYRWSLLLLVVVLSGALVVPVAAVWCGGRAWRAVRLIGRLVRALAVRLWVECVKFLFEERAE